MTDDPKAQAETAAGGKDAQLQKLIRKLDRSARFKRRAVAGALVGATALSPVVAAATDSYDLAPLPDCEPFSVSVQAQDAASSATQKLGNDLVNVPAGNGSVVLQSVLISAGDAAKMEEMDKALPIAIRTAPSTLSVEYENSCGIRQELRDVTMFNPALYDAPTYASLKDDPSHYVTLQALAAYYDEASDSMLRAYFEPSSGTLTIQSVGMTEGEGYERALAAASGNTDRVIPYELAEDFIRELQQTILENHLSVKQTAIAAHSMGASGGILIKGMLETSQVNRLVFGAQPSLTIIEGFGESQAAETISKERDIPLATLTRNSVSLRSLKDGAANLVAHEWDGNHPIGEQVYAVESVSEDTHALPSMAIGLLRGKNHIVPYDGTFTAKGAEGALAVGGGVLAKLVKAGRDAREGLGIG